MDEQVPRSEAKGLIRKLAEVIAETGYVEKSGTNQKQGYKYAQEADVLAMVREGLAKRHVACLPSIDSVHREKLYETASGNTMWVTDVMVRWTFLDGETGEVHECLMPGCGADTGDKGLYKAITGSSKYMFLKGFMLPTGDDPEDEKPDFKEGKAAAEKVGRAKIEAKLGPDDGTLSFTPDEAGMTHLSGMSGIATLRANLTEEQKADLHFVWTGKDWAVPHDSVQDVVRFCTDLKIPTKLVPTPMERELRYQQIKRETSATPTAAPKIFSCEHRFKKSNHQEYMVVRWGSSDVSMELCCWDKMMFPYIEHGVGKEATFQLKKNSAGTRTDIIGIERIGEQTFSLNDDGHYQPDIQTKATDADLPKEMFP